MTRTLHATELGPLAAGLLALVVGTAFGWDARFVEVVVAPPTLVRAVLVAGAAALGMALLGGAFRRIGAGGPSDRGLAPYPGAASSRNAEADRSADLPTMIRGVRLVFLAVAAFAAAAGWLVGHPLPIVVALIIAGVDVVETSFLLLVVRFTRRRGPAA